MSKKVDSARPAEALDRSLGSPRVDLTTDVWLAADLSMSLCNVVHKPAHGALADGDSWRRRAAALDGDFLEGIDRYAKEVWINLLGLPFDVPAARTAAGFVETIGSMDAAELVRYLVGYYRRVFRRETPAEVMDAAIAGDRAARREFRRTSFTDEGWGDCLRHLLSVEPAAIQAELAGLLRRWHGEVYAATEADVDVALRASLQLFRSAAEGLSLERTVELAAPGLTFIAEAGQTSVVLVPSIALRPLWAVTDHRAANVFAFPAPRREDEAATPPPSRLVALGKAIGDETRLRILRELATEPATPPDLADRMGIPRTTLLHHLRSLREAQLIAVRVNDAHYHQYHVRDEHFGEIERLLSDYLG